MEILCGHFIGNMCVSKMLSPVASFHHRARDPVAWPAFIRIPAKIRLIIYIVIVFSLVFSQRLGRLTEDQIAGNIRPYRDVAGMLEINYERTGKSELGL